MVEMIVPPILGIISGVYLWNIFNQEQGLSCEKWMIVLTYALSMFKIWQDLLRGVQS